MAPKDPEQALRKAFSDIDRQWNGLLTQYNRIVDTVEDLGLPGSPLRELVTYHLKDPMRRLHHGLTEASATIREILDHDTPLVSLVRASGSWYEIERAAASLHREADPVTRRDRNDDLGSWRGEAATGYRDRVRTQLAAVSEVGSLAGYAGAWLDDVATANLTFLATISGIIGEAVRTATAAAADIAEVVAIPKAAEKIGDLCGEVVGRLLPKAAFTLLDQILANQVREHALSHAQNERELVLDGAWPQAIG